MNILVVGDSIAQGFYDHQQGGRVERLKLWGFSQEDCSIYNQGVSGHSTRDLLKRLEITCQMKTFDIIMIAIGINDSRYQDDRNNIESNDFQINLDKIFEIASRYTPKIIFVGLTRVDEGKTTPIPWKTSISYFNKYITVYDHLIQSFAILYNLQYIPMYDLLDYGDLEDGLHPNTQGHQKMFERVLKYLQDNKLI